MSMGIQVEQLFQQHYAEDYAEAHLINDEHAAISADNAQKIADGDGSCIVLPQFIAEEAIEAVDRRTVESQTFDKFACPKEVVNHFGVTAMRSAARWNQYRTAYLGDLSPLPDAQKPPNEVMVSYLGTLRHANHDIIAGDALRIGVYVALERERRRQSTEELSAMNPFEVEDALAPLLLHSIVDLLVDSPKAGGPTSNRVFRELELVGEENSSFVGRDIEVDFTMRTMHYAESNEIVCIVDDDQGVKAAAYSTVDESMLPMTSEDVFYIARLFVNDYPYILYEESIERETSYAFARQAGLLTNDGSAAAEPNSGGKLIDFAAAKRRRSNRR